MERAAIVMWITAAIESRRRGQSGERIARDVDRGSILEAEQALDYGMVDKIIARREK
jgi:ATP-dependent protease ClpP protease subunit